MENSNKAKHTPGPWKTWVHPSHKDGAIGILTNKGQGYGGIAYVSVLSSIMEGTTEANANLIAAAPELLEALEFALAEYEEYFIPTGKTKDDVVITKLRAAINKAKGQ